MVTVPEVTSSQVGEVRSLKLAGGLELGVLLGRGRLGRAHGDPDGVGVGVGVVDAEVFEQDLVTLAGMPEILTVTWEAGTGRSSSW